MNIVKLYRLHFLLLAAATLSCSIQPLTGGSDLPNGVQIAGTVERDDGAPSSGTLVQLIPANYDPVRDPPLPAGNAAITDDRGIYTLVAPDTGMYNILAIERERRTRALLLAVAAFSETVFAPQATLKKTGSIKVAFSKGEVSDNGYLYIPGTTIASPVGSADGFVVLDSVPAGTIPEIFYRARSDSTTPVKIAAGIPVSSGGVFTIAYREWMFSKKLILNTTVSGAGISSTLTGFPVLVRLGGGNFSFDQARPDGADLRFSKADGTPLPYEIERWDASAGRAEIWVRVDTIHGNNAVQNIVMYWGASTPSISSGTSGAVTTSESNGAAVFDTANGFQGVWHLGESGDSISDATGNAFNGKKSGSNPASGMIGNAEDFANGKYIKIPGQLNRPSNITLSVWVRSDTVPGRGQEVVSISDAALIRFDDVKGFGTGGSFHNSPSVGDSMYGGCSSGRYLAKTGWRHLAFSINTVSHVQTFYIDGVAAISTYDVNSIYYTGLGTDTYLGIHGNGKTGFSFIGQMDEVRVNSNPLEPDWVKLCFMNQKEQDALIIW